MKKLVTLAALILGLGAAAPVLGAEQPLLLVVSDFDVALRREAATSEVVPAAEASASDELARILALLRQPRPGRDATQPPTTARPL